MNSTLLRASLRQSFCLGSLPLRGIVDARIHSLPLAVGQRSRVNGRNAGPELRLGTCSRSKRSREFRIFCSSAESLTAEGKDGHASSTESYGFLGLGIMGVAMAKNLLKLGVPLTVWNRSPDKCGPLVELGATAAKTPAEVVAKSTITFAMLADPAVALAVALGPGGVVEGIAPGRSYVDMSTVDAETSANISKVVYSSQSTIFLTNCTDKVSVRMFEEPPNMTSDKLWQAITEKGGRFLEGPVSGSKKPAEDGQLVILAAGDESLFHDVAAPFDVLGKKSFYLGEVGNGAKMKLVVNMIMGSMMAAFSEGLALAEKTGLKQNDLLDVVELGAIASPIFKLKGPSVIKGSFAPAFPLKHQQKDMRLALALGDEVAQTMPVAAAANEVYKKARTMGLGDNDFSAIYKAVTEGS
ncbi:hypothetical protein R1sor_008607 [Riccia sorocarpa]|uniref:Uncharacterized protein n=1 Tax=Riccia sorocarpa TaxID=122646 RepID=A0ABD3HW04_9MARC